ncbi:hypothetical protein RI543_001504 [Arxiozyma heterogenica]|uniref:Uncharacterized protein n=1 Tax=Arxiozyma heterogenica TaxID=278026 RepID=A0AAN7WP39_9SACH|nr:hypothetical protein RI543_001504 [Kazachstania heterogenica]
MLKSYHIIYADVYSKKLLANEHLNALDNSQLSTTSRFSSINGLKWLSTKSHGGGSPNGSYEVNEWNYDPIINNPCIFNSQ